MINPAFSSGIASVLQRYVGMKRALGRQFDSATQSLQSLDRLHAPKGYPDLTAATFDAWCKAQEHLASGVRRVRMLDVHAFCVYRRRTEPECFLPDPTSFPPYHQRLRPHIFSESEVARLMEAASRLKCNPSTPLRPELTRLAIVLLFTTGIRRGELLKLTEADYDRREATLHIRATKFYKSRLLPIHEGIANEIEKYLSVRAKAEASVVPRHALDLECDSGRPPIHRYGHFILHQAAPASVRHQGRKRAHSANPRFSSSCRLPDHAESPEADSPYVRFGVGFRA